jgi:tetratricopeptide (TPR) repeat protein
MSHPTVETLMRHAQGLLSENEEGEVTRHVEGCRECRAQEDAARSFGARLDHHWLDAKLTAMLPEGWDCPSAQELGSYFLGEAEGPEAERLAGHSRTCLRCRAVLDEMEAGTAALRKADPLGQSRPPSPSRNRLRAVLDSLSRPAWVPVALALGLGAGLLLRPIVTGHFGDPPIVGGYRIVKPAPAPPAQLRGLGVAPSVDEEAERRFREALAFYGEPDFAARALPKLNEAVTIDPRHELAWFWLGVAYLLRGEPKAAIAPLETAVRLAPGNLEYKQYLVWAYLAVGSVDKALAIQTEIVNRR